ncbi:uncharacterized protein [Palaemon carinicauda]|uniref:uncharacterized protein n=1 Tax=Palaemon carinicauda TaxID=392227 RepID=UPI0035B67D6F
MILEELNFPTEASSSKETSHAPPVSGIDDILILADYFHKCEAHTQMVIEVLTELGWQISIKKSVIHPVQKIEFLGVHYNLENKTMRPMQKNIDKFIRLANTVLNLNRSDLKLYQRLIGSLTLCSYYTFYGRYYLKFLHRFHRYFAKGYRIIPPSFKSFLGEWKQTNMYSDINISNNQVDLELFTDASNFGWGGALVGEHGILSTNNTWLQNENTLHINIRELLACIYCIKHFRDKLRNKVVLIHIDSQVTNCWIKKHGSIRNKSAQEAIKVLLNIKGKYNIDIQTKWIKGKCNVIADSLSRDFGSIHPEATLDDNLFNLICTDMNFSPEIDLFTNGFNSKCKRFCSSVPNTKAISNNALHISWEGSSPLYAFPPGFLLHKVAFKIYNECNNNMLFCTVSQETEPWIPLVKRVSKEYRKYKVKAEGCQILHMDCTLPLAQHHLNLITFRI